MLLFWPLSTNRPTFFSPTTLISIVLSLADGRPKVRYVLAVDESHNTLKQIVKAVSNQLGNGRIQYISKEDALLNKDISVREV